ncbi:LPXTG-motif cell wall anchor domain-containing protein [Kandleria vitulina]|uniref:LPXTG-motif cell wall anchor domain-containing protein n=1 Tax=Kandleria vitulina TaxID=1630 RepID=A0A1H2U2H4_9FIRM|nr:LPXTG cell wall anchor domain-containing protein [Kandleria vitulina]SDW49624.1 LPXTG-motif cell wall anchor domain-containing protein [Kandleria vitulina]
MKYFKTIICLFLSLAFLATPVTAANSIQRRGRVLSAYSRGKKITGDTIRLKNTFTGVGNNLATIQDINSGVPLTKVFSSKKINNTTKYSLRQFKLLTRLQEIRSDSGKYYTDMMITWEVNNLMSKNVYLLVYDKVTKEWSIVKPESVDLANKTITAKFAHMSVVGVLYVSSNKTVNNNVKTGDDTNVVMYILLATISLLALISVFIFRKKSKL